MFSTISRKTVCLRLVWLSAVGCMCPLFSAGAADRPVILNTGEATLFALPGQVEFTFVRHFIGDTLQTSIAQCDAFIKAAPQAIRGSELQPLDVRTSPPVITAMAQRQTRAIVTVRFSMAVFNTARTGPTQFAALCDKMEEMAKTMKATLAAPEFIPVEREGVEAAAVARATENAYPPAEAIAQALKSNIYAVEQVEILGIDWEQQPQGQTADVPQLGCTARVRVTYALSPGN